METLFCLVRHGVTDWNYDGRAQGQTDIPLNNEGLNQAEAMAERLSRESWDAIYSSTLRRAIQTAQALSRRTGHTVATDPRLMERNMGVAEGTTFAERHLRWPGVEWKDLSGIESNDVMALRATEALREIAARHPGERVVCIAHGGLLHAFLHSIAPDDAAIFHHRNTAITRVRYDGEQFHLVEPPDHSHLIKDGLEFTGEKWWLRVHGGETASLWTGIPQATLDKAFDHATAVESAWANGKLVAFARLFTDGVLSGYIDLQGALPDYDHVLSGLVNRLQARYPSVRIVHLPQPSGGGADAQ